MQNQIIVRIEGVGAFRMPCELARAVLENPRVYAANFAGLPGTLPQESYTRSPDVYVTSPCGITFAPCGDNEYCVWDYGNFPCVEIGCGSPASLGHDYPHVRSF